VAGGRRLDGGATFLQPLLMETGGTRGVARVMDLVGPGTAIRKVERAATEADTEASLRARIGQRKSGGADARKARAVLQQSRLQAGFTEVRAPFDGVVTHRLREPGSVIAAGQPVLTLARLDQLWVRVYLPQALQGQVRLGAPVTVITADKRLLEASLDEIGSESEFTPKMVESREERVNLVYPARVNLPQGWDKGLVPGAAVDVRLGGPSR